MVSLKSLLDQCRHRTTLVCGNLGQWPDRVMYYEQDYPYTVIFEPNFGVHIPRLLGKSVIVFMSHLDLTWDKWVELRFFQVGRPPSHRVWEAYQLQTTDAYILDFADCPRVAYVYVKWLTWLMIGKCIETTTSLDAWCVSNLGSGLWKKHVQRSHKKALVNGVPSDVTLL
ncbi:uncharacterized protein TNCV_4616791 [Trichonephila clavipes]|nr:uncharacterized protein TNCV_4616791 [Trichonephila clavipes]